MVVAVPDYTLEYTFADTGVIWRDANGVPLTNVSNSVPQGSTFTLGSAGASAIVTDDDGVLEDTVNAPPQSLDTSQQILSQPFGTNAAGDFVRSRGYYEIEDGQGNVGRLYELRIQSATAPFGTTQYWVFSGNIVVDPSMTYTVRGTPDNGTMWLNGYGNVDSATLTEPRCFPAGTLIEAEAGAVAVENLKVGDRVRTRDHGLKPIRWIDTQHLDAQLLAQMPHMRPIRVRAGVLGAGLPRRDLCLSPQHRLVVRNAIVARMFGIDEVLVAVKHLLDIDGLEPVPDGAGVSYFHFLLDRHAIVLAEGAEAETLYTGPQALKTMDPEARRELLALFPQLAVLGHDALPARAGRFAEGRRARRLAERAARNRVALLAG